MILLQGAQVNFPRWRLRGLEDPHVQGTNLIHEGSVPMLYCFQETLSVGAITLSINAQHARVLLGHSYSDRSSFSFSP